MLSWLEEKLGSRDFKLFISRSFTDDDWLKEYLEGALSDMGVDLVMPKRISMENEREAWRDIENKIALSDALLVVLSKKGKVSRYVHYELGYANGKNKPIIALIQTKKSKFTRPWFLDDNAYLVFKDSDELTQIQEYVKMNVQKKWDKKKADIRGNIILGGIVIGGLILGSLFPGDDDDF